MDMNSQTFSDTRWTWKLCYESIFTWYLLHN